MGMMLAPQLVSHVAKGFNYNQAVNSIIFDNSLGTSMSRTFDSDEGDTWSFFMIFKRLRFGTREALFGRSGNNASISLGTALGIELNDDGAYNRNTTELMVDPNGYIFLLVTGNGTTNKVYQGFNQLILDGVCNIGALNTASTHYIGDAGFAIEQPGISASVIGFVSGTELTPEDIYSQDSRGEIVYSGYDGDYGGNGFLLEKFSGSTPAEFGYDKRPLSGGQTANDWSVTGFTIDQLSKDTWANNHWQLRHYWLGGSGYPSGFAGTQIKPGSSAYTSPFATTNILPKDKPYAWSMEDEGSVGGNGVAIGVVTKNSSWRSGLGYTDLIGGQSDEYGWLVGVANGNVERVYNGGSHDTVTATTFAQGSKIACGYDPETSTISIFIDGTEFDSYVIPENEYFPAFSSNNVTWRVNFGQFGDDYCPSTHKTLCTASLSKPIISNGNLHSYSAKVAHNGTSTDFEIPWDADVYDTEFRIKRRTGVQENHFVFDGLRGYDKRLIGNEPNAEDTSSTHISVSGTTITLLGSLASADYVVWCTRFGLAGGVENTDGSITATVSANPDAGASLLLFDGIATNGTVGHGLNEPPEWITVKNLDDVASWRGGSDYTKASDPWSEYMVPNSNTSRSNSSTVWQDTAPTDAVAYIGTANEVNGNTNRIRMECHHSVPGYKKIGRIVGTAAQQFIPCDFVAQRMWIKRVDSSGDYETITMKLSPNNPIGRRLFLNNDSAENTGISNLAYVTAGGVVINTTSTNWNANGGEYIYMIEGEQPFGGKGIAPATAF